MKESKQKKQKCLSIIVPMYNAQKYIKKCLDSLLLIQEEMDRLEVVIVDDGSIDQGAETAAAYCRKYPNTFVLLRQQNGGHGAAVDAGIACCRGKYFKVLDADDWVHTNALRRVLKLLENLEAQVVVCGYDICQDGSGRLLHRAAACEDTRVYRSQKRDKRTWNKIAANTDINMKQVIRQWDTYAPLFCLHGLLYQTDFYRKLGYRLPKKISYDDAFFFTVPCSHADRISVLDLQLYVYQVGDAGQSVSAQNREARIHQAEAVIRAIIRTREGVRSEFGQEYWYRKLISVVSDYYVTAYLRCRNRRAGRCAAQRFTEELKVLDRELYCRTKGRKRLLFVMGMFHRQEKDFVWTAAFVRKCRRLWAGQHVRCQTEKSRMKADVYLKILAKSVLQQAMIVPVAAGYYKTRLAKSGVFNLIVCDHIGDFLLTMGYVRAFQKAYGIRRLRMVCTEKFKDLAEMYPDTNCEFYAISPQSLHLLCIANRYVLGQQLFDSWKDNCVVEPANRFLQGLEHAAQFPGLHLKDCICYGSLGLKEGGSFDMPVYQKDGKQSAGGCKELAGRVLLCPSARSVCYKQAGLLFLQLEQAIKSMGWQVDVNAELIGLQELCGQLRHFDCVIGMRSGLLDLAVFAPCRVVALYPPTGGMEQFYDLRHTNPGHPQTFQYRLTGQMDTDLQAVLRMAGATNKSKGGSKDAGAIYHYSGGRKRHTDETADTQ